MRAAGMERRKNSGTWGARDYIMICPPVCQPASQPSPSSLSPSPPFLLGTVPVVQPPVHQVALDQVAVLLTAHTLVTEGPSQPGLRHTLLLEGGRDVVLLKKSGDCSNFSPRGEGG